MATKRKTLVLVAGATDHGHGEHDYPAGMRILQRALTEALPHLDVVLIHQIAPFKGWVEDEALFARADAVVIYSGGSGGNPIRSHWDTLRQLCARGAGLGCMHYTVEVINGTENDTLRQWIGGAYEDGFSTNPDCVQDVIPASGHPVSHGVKPFTVKDEFYFNLRFPEDRTGWTSVLECTPDDACRQWNNLPHIIAASGRRETVLWTLERPDGGRGFGFTGGHSLPLWAQDDYRKVVLNAIAWLAKEDIPTDGIPSRPPSASELQPTT